MSNKSMCCDSVVRLIPGLSKTRELIVEGVRYRHKCCLCFGYCEVYKGDG